MMKIKVNSKQEYQIKLNILKANILKNKIALKDRNKQVFMIPENEDQR